MLTKDQVEAAFVEYARAVLGSGVTIIRTHQHGPRPPLPYLGIGVIAGAPIGEAVSSVAPREGDPDFSHEEHSRQIQRVTISAHAYGEPALVGGWLEQLEAERVTEVGLALHEDHGIALMGTGGSSDRSAGRGPSLVSERHLVTDFFATVVRETAPRGIVTATTIETTSTLVVDGEDPLLILQLHTDEV